MVEGIEATLSMVCYGAKCFVFVKPVDCLQESDEERRQVLFEDDVERQAIKRLRVELEVK